MNDQLAAMGETLNTWATKNGLSLRIVNDLISGRLIGTRGVGLATRLKLEETFGKDFRDRVERDSDEIDQNDS